VCAHDVPLVARRVRTGSNEAREVLIRWNSLSSLSPPPPARVMAGIEQLQSHHHHPPLLSHSPHMHPPNLLPSLLIISSPLSELIDWLKHKTNRIFKT
jgi:hypothetical protein